MLYLKVNMQVKTINQKYLPYVNKNSTPNNENEEKERRNIKKKRKTNSNQHNFTT